MKDKLIFLVLVIVLNDYSVEEFVAIFYFTWRYYFERIIWYMEISSDERWRGKFVLFDNFSVFRIVLILFFLDILGNKDYFGLSEF